MKWIDIAIIAAVVLVLGLILRYIRRTRKKGIKCIGCPDRAKCCDHCSGSCCGTHQQEERSPR